MSETYALRLRITFASDDSVKYVGHLDMARTWERAIRRAALPLAYTQGFNPQPRIQFAAALPVGFTAEADIIDIYLNEGMPGDEVLARLGAALPPGIHLLAAEPVAREVPSLQSQLAAARYHVEVETEDPDEVFRERLAAFLRRAEAWRERRRGKESASYDLRPLVLSRDYAGPCLGGQSFRATMRSEAGATGRPDELLAELGYGEAPRRISRLALEFR